tara:strand:+ start:213 stop:359 length:147 start_codon:yes stop_codon:yes gene_type:complete
VFPNGTGNCVEPRLAVTVVKRFSPRHLVNVSGGVKIVGIEKGSAQAFR